MPPISSIYSCFSEFDANTLLRPSSVLANLHLLAPRACTALGPPHAGNGPSPKDGKVGDLGVPGPVEALAYERAERHRDEEGKRSNHGGSQPRDMAERLHYERGGEKGTVTISNSNFLTGPPGPQFLGSPGAPLSEPPQELPQVEAIEIHHLDPCAHEVVHECLLPIVTSVDFRYGAKLGV